MPPGNNRRKGTRQPKESTIDALPDGVLERVLGFLPAEDAVRTCVLARRWRHLWKSAASLRVVSTGGQFLEPSDKHREFMDHLLLGRGGAALESFEFRIGDDYVVLLSEEDVLSFESWFRHAVTSKAQVLRLPPLVSKHLTRLELSFVEVEGSFLNFSGCPNLEHLEFKSCSLSFGSTKISFQSLKHLSITCCRLGSIMDLDSRIRITAPNLVSLVLDNCFGLTPILESMPSLMEASVRICDSIDRCQLWDANYWECNCKSCDTHGGGTSCVLLNGLSEATSLMLISETTMCIFRRDIKRCPIFSNLKNLWLNDYWCIPEEFSMLTCILEHSPILEKLTLEFVSGKHKLELEGNISSTDTERSATISEYLKKVKVKCSFVDDIVISVLKFLHVTDICFRYE
ncbi:hypothetical protein EJB05_28444, partial [Eragrostis curvula]